MTGRPPKVVDKHPVHILLPADTVQGLDEWVEELRGQIGSGGITRADLMRDLLSQAVRERREKKGRP